MSPNTRPIATAEARPATERQKRTPMVRRPRRFDILHLIGEIIALRIQIAWLRWRRR